MLFPEGPRGGAVGRKGLPAHGGRVPGHTSLRHSKGLAGVQWGTGGAPKPPLATALFAGAAGENCSTTSDSGFPGCKHSFWKVGIN